MIEGAEGWHSASSETCSIGLSVLKERLLMGSIVFESLYPAADVVTRGVCISTPQHFLSRLHTDVRSDTATYSYGVECAQHRMSQHPITKK